MAADACLSIGQGDQMMTKKEEKISRWDSVREGPLMT